MTTDDPVAAAEAAIVALRAYVEWARAEGAQLIIMQRAACCAEDAAFAIRRRTMKTAAVRAIRADAALRRREGV